MGTYKILHELPDAWIVMISKPGTESLETTTSFMHVAPQISNPLSFSTCSRTSLSSTSLSSTSLSSTSLSSTSLSSARCLSSSSLSSTSLPIARSTSTQFNSTFSLSSSSSSLQSSSSSSSNSSLMISNPSMWRSFHPQAEVATPDKATAPKTTCSVSSSSLAKKPIRSKRLRAKTNKKTLIYETSDQENEYSSDNWLVKKQSKQLSTKQQIKNRIQHKRIQISSSSSSSSSSVSSSSSDNDGNDDNKMSFFEQTMVAHDLDEGNVDVKWNHTRDSNTIVHSTQFRGDFGQITNENQKLAFVCLSSGEVFSSDHPGLVMFEYYEGDDPFDLQYAPGQIMDISKDVEGQITIAIRFLIDDKLFLKSLEIPLSLDDVYTMSLQSAKLSIGHIPRNMYEKLMPKYKLVLNRWFSTNPYREVGLWRHKNLKRREDKNISMNLYDFLELYYIRDAWVWRSALGTHIWHLYVNPISTFGIKPRLDLVNRVMVMSKFESKPLYNARGEPLPNTLLNARNVDCSACGKKNVTCSAQMNDEDEKHTKMKTIGFGYVCAAKLECLHNIGKCIQNFRNAKFDPKNYDHVFTEIRVLFESYEAEAKNIKEAFE